MVRREVKVINTVRLHARPAVAFVKATSGFPCNVRIETQSGHADAKSLLMVLALGVIQGTQITIVAEGPGEEQAADALAGLVASGFSGCS